jgi:nucleotide-binding universal stress UspA family protein
MRANSRYKEIVKRGDVAMEVLRTADAAGADLIVLGAERRGLRDATTFGANSHSILRNAQHAVLTVSRLQPRQIRFARRLRASA